MILLCPPGIVPLPASDLGSGKANGSADRAVASLLDPTEKSLVWGGKMVRQGLVTPDEDNLDLGGDRVSWFRRAGQVTLTL